MGRPKKEKVMGKCEVCGEKVQLRWKDHDVCNLCFKNYSYANLIRRIEAGSRMGLPKRGAR